MTRTTIRARLLWSFSIAILIPSVLTTVVAVLRIREQVYAQAQARVTADVEAAKEIYQNYVDRLRDAVRAHATRYCEVTPRVKIAPAQRKGHYLVIRAASQR